MTRPRLQLHLSTLLMVSLLGAGLAWLNVRTTTFERWMGFLFGYVEFEGQGWPVAFKVWDTGRTNFDDYPVHWTALAIDVAISLALLAVATVAIEWATRRMKRNSIP